MTRGLTTLCKPPGGAGKAAPLIFVNDDPITFVFGDASIQNFGVWRDDDTEAEPAIVQLSADFGEIFKFDARFVIWGTWSWRIDVPDGALPPSTVTVTVKELEQNQTASIAFDIIVEYPPEIEVDDSTPTVAENGNITITGTWRDTDGTVMPTFPNSGSLPGVFSAVEDTPSDFTSGTWQLVMTNVQLGTAGQYTVEIEDSDGHKDDTVFDLTVTPAVSQVPPTIDSDQPEYTAVQGDSITITGTWTDSDATGVSPATLTQLGLDIGTEAIQDPLSTGSTWDFVSQALSQSDSGAKGFRITDEQGLTAEVQVNIVVGPPTQTVNARQKVFSVPEFTSVSTELDWTDSDANADTLTADFGSVTGPPVNGVKSGTETWSTGNLTLADNGRVVTITYTDQDGNQAFDQISISVVPIQTNIPPVISFDTDPITGNAGVWTVDLPVGTSHNFTGDWRDEDNASQIKSIEFDVESDIIAGVLDDGDETSQQVQPFSFTTSNLKLIHDGKTFIATITDELDATGIAAVTVLFTGDDPTRLAAGHPNPKVSEWTWEESASTQTCVFCAGPTPDEVKIAIEFQNDPDFETNTGASNLGVDWAQVINDSRVAGELVFPIVDCKSEVIVPGPPTTEAGEDVLVGSPTRVFLKFEWLPLGTAIAALVVIPQAWDGSQWVWVWSEEYRTTPSGDVNMDCLLVQPMFDASFEHIVTPTGAITLTPTAPGAAAAPTWQQDLSNGGVNTWVNSAPTGFGGGIIVNNQPQRIRLDASDANKTAGYKSYQAQVMLPDGLSFLRWEISIDGEVLDRGDFYDSSATTFAAEDETNLTIPTFPVFDGQVARIQFQGFRDSAGGASTPSNQPFLTYSRVGHSELPDFPVEVGTEIWKYDPQSITPLDWSNHVVAGSNFLAVANGRLQSRNNSNNLPIGPNTFLDFPINYIAPELSAGSLVTSTSEASPDRHGQVRLRGTSPNFTSGFYVNGLTSYRWACLMHFPASVDWPALGWSLFMQGHPGSFGGAWSDHVQAPITVYVLNNEWRAFGRGSNQSTPANYTQEFSTPPGTLLFSAGLHEITLEFRMDPLGSSSFMRVWIDNVQIADFSGGPIGINHSAIGPGTNHVFLSMGHYGSIAEEFDDPADAAKIEIVYSRLSEI